MEVLALIPGNFHDPNVRWNIKIEDGSLHLSIASKEDRMLLVFSVDEMQTICGLWTSQQFACYIPKESLSEPPVTSAASVGRNDASTGCDDLQAPTAHSEG